MDSELCPAQAAGGLLSAIMFILLALSALAMSTSMMVYTLMQGKSKTRRQLSRHFNQEIQRTCEELDNEVMFC